MSIKFGPLAVCADQLAVPDMADGDRIVDVDWELQSMRGTFSQLLFADDLLGPEVESSSETAHLGTSHSYLSPYSKQDFPRMLCFGNTEEEGNEVEAALTEPARCRIDPKRSSSSSNSTVKSPKHLPKCKRRDGSVQELAVLGSSDIVSTTHIAHRRNSKRSKVENGPSKRNRQTKARGARLGERITALQQLVSPYGKTDIATVLHEATGYIKFLHEQVQVLCSPYLQQFPSFPDPLEGQGNRSEESILTSGKRSLRSRGLCLVPIACTIPVAACNGADFWSPAMCHRNLSSSSPRRQ